MSHDYYPGFPVGRVAFSGDPAARRFAFETDEFLRGSRPSPVALIEVPAAIWSSPGTMTDMNGAAANTYVDVFGGAGAEGAWQLIDFGDVEAVAADILWNKAAGVGQHDLRAVSADNESFVLFELTDLVTGRNVIEPIEVAEWAVNGQHRLKLQARSTTALDDPVLQSAVIRVR